MSECCSEPTCRRKQPMMLMRSDLTGTWYIVTRWKKRDHPGSYEAVEKHRLPDDQQAQLEGMRAVGG